MLLAVLERLSPQGLPAGTRRAGRALPSPGIGDNHGKKPLRQTQSKGNVVKVDASASPFDFRV